MVSCPICAKHVKEADINRHIDSECKSYIEGESPPATQAPAATQANGIKSKPKAAAAAFFTPAAKKSASFRADEVASSSPANTTPVSRPSIAPSSTAPVKRPREDDDEAVGGQGIKQEEAPPPAKKAKDAHKPLAERMRPQSLDDVAGQDLVGPNGVLRNLIVSDRVPSMVLWGGPGTGKTTIARLIAQTAGTRFVEINSTSSGVAECKKLFAEAKNEMGLTGRKTIIFCDEIHRFTKSQQDVFLGPVENGQVTLIGATTENPSFKVVNALLSRCRTFVLSKLTDEHIFDILKRALFREVPGLPTPSPSPSTEGTPEATATNSFRLLTEDDYSLLHYLAAFADGDARTGLNLLELALDLCHSPSTTTTSIKASLTQTLVYDRAGDQHYDTISALHKSIRGSCPNATLYYLARMLQSGEDPLYIARRMVVIASEDIGLADPTHSLLPLATATYTACEKIGMPECRINLAHCAVALALSPKSVRAYRGLNAAYSALKEPGIAGLPIPVHLRNAPTKLMKELDYGKDYKYNPDYVEGRVVQDYLPEKLQGRVFLGSRDLGEEVDPEVAELEEQLRCAAEEHDQGEEVLLGPDGD
ncbi:Putative AAA+ ATPase domain, ATPase, AAA-type, core, rad18, zinc finger UBZ4-type, MgsA AAA+ ATPase [Septoria linicola]|uniref:AAA+ ATPase domain, ATPase, AAA-type, core, rad18, zinc finger UBZ4-type, MgsA AAA+ ATPase n=1 Tax=Septoria linicola TaxID=215465 RepID=A0A9Q9B5Y3_9PEZI|nr:Putative AAA+ ATPase domain, ATPase, AAA-type, core, rad18, zinc finger UBZ4-type, MgsA AAA+ ATPase [Septoria linicola]